MACLMARLGLALYRRAASISVSGGTIGGGIDHVSMANSWTDVTHTGSTHLHSGASKSLRRSKLGGVGRPEMSKVIAPKSEGEARVLATDRRSDVSYPAQGSRDFLVLYM